MAIKRDVRTILDVFLISNLATIANFGTNLNTPRGLQKFIDTETVNNVKKINFPSDLANLLENYILTRQLGIFSFVQQTEQD